MSWDPEHVLRRLLDALPGPRRWLIAKVESARPGLGRPLTGAVRPVGEFLFDQSSGSGWECPAPEVRPLDSRSRPVGRRRV